MTRTEVIFALGIVVMALGWFQEYLLLRMWRKQCLEWRSLTKDGEKIADRWKAMFFEVMDKLVEKNKEMP